VLQPSLLASIVGPAAGLRIVILHGVPTDRDEVHQSEPDRPKPQPSGSPAPLLSEVVLTRKGAGPTEPAWRIGMAILERCGALMTARLPIVTTIHAEQQGAEAMDSDTSPRPQVFVIGGPRGDGLDQLTKHPKEPRPRIGRPIRESVESLGLRGPSGQNSG